jgi:hypothetical protein
MNGALVSVIVGPTHQALWQRYCRPSWEAYAHRHHLDLVILPDLIDPTERGQRRSPAWQKLLIGRIPELRRYRRVAWIDADIVINAAKAPCLFDTVPSEKVGAVRSQFFFENPLAADAFHRVCGPFASTQDYNRAVYALNDLPADCPRYVNTGVLACVDFDLGWLELVYQHEPRPKSFQEQAFLSHALVGAGCLWELDPRFNVEWYPLKFSVFDFANGNLSELKRLCLRQALSLSYFLHFNGNQEDIPFLDGEAHPSPDGRDVSAAALDSIHRQLAQEIRRTGPDPCWGAAVVARRQQLTESVFAATGGVVQAGPFRGMQIRPEPAWGDGDFAAKLLGFYEEELHPEIARAIARRYPTVAVIGSAEGFYAVGLALRSAGSRIVAFDSSYDACWSGRANAEANGVAGRIDFRGACTTRELNTVLAQAGRAYVLMDCEGAERELLNPEAVPSPAGCDFLVECHDFAHAGITDELRRRFAKTHEVVCVREGPRDPNASPILRSLPSTDRWLAISENRPTCMNWLIGQCRKRLGQ